MTDNLSLQYEKSFTSLRHWLMGRGYYRATQALQTMRDRHKGMRKDGITPVEIHPLTVTQYVRTLEPALLHPEETIAASLLHDTVEDTGMAIGEIERMFGEQVAMAVQLLSKTDGTRRTPDEAYYTMMCSNAIASVAKGADRAHNIQSMIGVFSLAKQREYLDETRQHVLPMLKHARRNFPQQYPAYMNLKLMLISQLELIEHIHAATSANPPGA